MADSDNFVKKLDACRRQAPDGGEFWMARDIQPELGYATWENFEAVIHRARTACDSSGVKSIHHFHDTTKLMNGGKGAQIARADLYLSRYACYLIAMNGDPAKKEIGYAQQYFAVQTRRQELQDKLTDHEQRAVLRDRVKSANKKLNEAAKNAKVQRYAIFHAAGYKALYDGLGVPEIKTRKGIPVNDDLLDCAGRTELALNEFRITQTEGKLIREEIGTEASAIRAHERVGTEVRAAISRIGGTMPEDLPAEPNINRLVSPKRRRELQDQNE